MIPTGSPPGAPSVAAVRATAAGIEGGRGTATARPGVAVGRALLAGVLLGVLSRIEETSSVSLGISSDATWVAVAFLAGVWVTAGAGEGAGGDEGGGAARSAGARGRGGAVRRAAACGALALTAANVSYYAWIASTQPSLELADVAGSPLRWIVLGVVGGALFAATGRLWIAARGTTRVLASAPLAGVCIADAIPAVLGGPLSAGFGLAVGAALPVASGDSIRTRALGAALAAVIIALALTGSLEALLP